ncbi:MAG TPA: sugar phosphate isomerase/epimerase [Chloroflexi bacterium]|nr:sugar phosphate isomerase/epimerase [Chloroflexota bacterium]
MRPGFMSSVCPEQTLSELIETAERYGYEGIEFRVEWGHHHGVELDATEAQLKGVRQKLVGHGIAASCVATSAKFNSPERADHLPQREALRRYVALAALIGAPYIRTFSDPLPEEDPALRDRVLSLAAESYASVDEWAGQHGVTVLVETHTNMKGQWARRILDASGARHLQVLWHIEHHLRRGQSVDEAYEHIRGYVGHVHFSALDDNPHVTDADNRRMFELLAADHFGGFISVEIINPSDPDSILAHHIAKYRQFLRSIQEGE